MDIKLSCWGVRLPGSVWLGACLLYQSEKMKFQNQVKSHPKCRPGNLKSPKNSNELFSILRNEKDHEDDLEVWVSTTEFIHIFSMVSWWWIEPMTTCSGKMHAQWQPCMPVYHIQCAPFSFLPHLHPWTWKMDSTNYRKYFSCEAWDNHCRWPMRYNHLLLRNSHFLLLPV
jgi:hypothetical protein